VLSFWWRSDGTVGAAGSAGFGWIDWGGRVGTAAARPVWPRTAVPAAPVRVAPVVVAPVVVWLVAVAVAVVVGSSAGEAVMAVADRALAEADRALAEAGGAVAVPDAGSTDAGSTDAGPTDAGPTCRVGSPVRAHARAADASDVSDVGWVLLADPSPVAIARSTQLILQTLLIVQRSQPRWPTARV